MAGGAGPDPQLLARARGALLGLVAGNQLGVPTERLGTAQAIRAAFPGGVRDLAPAPRGSAFDDDAAMTLLLAESLVERGDFDARDVAERWARWMRVDGRGIGLTTQRALKQIERGADPFELRNIKIQPLEVEAVRVVHEIDLALPQTQQPERQRERVSRTLPTPRLAAVERETKSYRWPAFMFAYMTGLAYLLSFGVFRIGTLLGF